MRKGYWFRLVTTGLVCLCVMVIFLYSVTTLPSYTNAGNPASVHVSPRYTLEAERETGSPNMVTAILADYRGFDTLGETTVIFTAGVVTFLLFLIQARTSKPAVQEEGSIILEVSFRFITPFILILAIYTLFHGEYSPGGGFQAGVLFGVAIILSRLVNHTGGRRSGYFDYSAIVIAGTGTLFYAIIGIVPMFFGGKFLEYSKLPIVADIISRHTWGMLLIEVGVTICVAATVVSIFDSLSKGVDKDGFDTIL